MRRIRTEYPRSAKRLTKKQSKAPGWWAVWLALFFGIGAGLLLAAAWRIAQVEQQLVESGAATPGK